MGFNRNSEAFINALVRALSLHNDVVCLITVLGSWTSRLNNKIFIGNCVRLSSDSMPTQHLIQCQHNTKVEAIALTMQLFQITDSQQLVIGLVKFSFQGSYGAVL